MTELTLYIGNKNRSSWSMRPWAFMRYHQVPFTEAVIPLYQPETAARLRELSPNGRVPMLQHNTATVWESDAICAHVAEAFELPNPLPSQAAERAMARSVIAEMHAGFEALRQELPFDATRDPAPVELSDAAQRDIARVRQIWRGARRGTREQGSWLFGAFGIADAMFMPVVLRFHTYAIPLDGPERDYADLVMESRPMVQWIEGAAMELPAGSARTGSAKPTHLAVDRTLELPKMAVPEEVQRVLESASAGPLRPEPAPSSEPTEAAAATAIRSFILPAD